MTGTVHDPTDLLREMLEEQFRRHTDRLTELTVRSRRPDRGGYDRDTLVAQMASVRTSVADTARALRRMAEGCYGTCECCATAIPLHRLEVVPEARFCGPCQRGHTAAGAAGQEAVSNAS